MNTITIQQKKNITLLIVSFLSVISFIISTIAFGFKYKNGAVIDLPQLGIASKKWNEIQTNVNYDSYYIRQSYGLMVAGLALSSFAVLLGIILVYISNPKINLDSKNNEIIKLNKKIIIFLILISSILVLSGELLFSIKSFHIVSSLTKISEIQAITNDPRQIPNIVTVKFTDVWDVGVFFGMLVFTCLPLPMLTIPRLIKK